MLCDSDSAVATEAAAGAPEHEIEITPAMTEAGEASLASFNLDFEGYEEAAHRVYRAMERARREGHVRRTMT